MRIVKFAISGSMIVVLLAGVAMAADLDGSAPSRPTPARQTAFEYDNYFYFAPEKEASESPSDAPPPPPADDNVDDDCAAACDECCGSCCDSCQRCCGDGLVSGWIDGGIMWNGVNPASGFNGPVTFNDSDGDFLVNQLYAVIEKATDTGGYGLDFGGRVDVLYGTDARFTKAAGWELNQNFTDRWNVAGQQYQLSVPQIYGEIACNDVKLKLGHFYTIIGHEVVTAPDNFFYSHAYTMQYAEPFTHFGGLLSWELGQLTLHGGIVNGWDAVDRVNDNASFLGGVTYAPHERWSLAFSIISGTEDDNIGGVSTRTMYSVVFDLNVTERLEYILQHDWGTQRDFLANGDHVYWYGVNQYLFYELNDCWKAGMRFEWFRDNDGVRVAGVDPNNPYTGGSVGDFYEISVGLNWTPYENLVVRPECRWDWFDGIGNRPYDDGNRNNQFLVGLDAILTF